MSGGVTARQGFLFQDLILAGRILDQIILHRRALIEGREPSVGPTFKTEATAEGEQTPEWDIIETSDNLFRFEEVKRGAVTAEDRRTLWRRIRDSLSSTGDDRSVEIRLTVNRDNLPDHPERWNQLASTSQSAQPTKPTRVDSADKLAQEALYWLTAPSGSERVGEEGKQRDLLTSPPLTIEQARLVLLGFILNDTQSADSAKAYIVERLALLTINVAVDALMNALVGAIYQRGAEEDANLHQFQVQEIIQTVEVLEQLSAVGQEAASLWQSISQISENRLAQALYRENGLEHHNISDIQPRLHETVNSTQSQCLALIGPGGIGKSYTLRNILNNTPPRHFYTILLTGHDLIGTPHETLAATFQLGRFLATCEQKELLVKIDALENASNNVEQRNSILSALQLHASPRKMQVVVTSRSTQWHELSGTQLSVPGWIAIELQAWSQEIVANAIQESQRPNVTPGLLELLRTPFLLDIFLRTFNHTQNVDRPLQSRHEVINLYWNTIVLPQDTRASARQQILDRFAEEESCGRTLHTGGTEDQIALRDLVSGGVLEIDSGRFRFRHTLLRDFALACFILNEANEVLEGAVSLTNSILDISPVLTRIGVLRAILEAISSDTALQSVPCNAVSLVNEAKRDSILLQMTAEVFGGQEDLGELRLDELAASSHASDQAPDIFIERLFSSALSSNNLSWLTKICELPQNTEWANQQPWITSQVLLAAGELLSRTDYTSTNSHCATTLSQWALAEDPLEGLSRHNSHGLMWLIEFLVPFLYVEEAINWLRRVGLNDWRTRMAVSRVLPSLGTRATPNEAMSIADLFVDAAGLAWENGPLLPAPDGSQTSMWGHQWIENALLGEDGLLDTQPTAFLPVVFGLLGGLSILEQQRRETEANEWLGALVATDQREERPLTNEERIITDIERGLDTMPEDEALGGLVRDIPFFWSTQNHRDAILAHLENLVLNWLTSQPSFVRGVYWPAVQSSCSMAGRIVLLASIFESELENQFRDVINTLLEDRRLYHGSDDFHLHRAIRFIWASGELALKNSILSNIESIARSPILRGAYAVGRLLCAVPESEHPSHLRTFMDVYTSLGHSPVPSRPLILGERQDTFNTARVEPSEQSNEPPTSRATRLVSAFHELLADLPSPREDSVGEVLGRLESCLSGLEQIQTQNNATEPPQLTELELTSAVEWALSVAASCPDASIHSNTSPLPIERFLHHEPNQFGDALRLASSVIHRLDDIDRSLTHSLANQINRSIPIGELQVSPATARRLFLINPGPLLRSAEGIEVMYSLLTRTVDLGALWWGLPWLVSMPASNKSEILTVWLATNENAPQSSLTTEWVGRLGAEMGRRAFDHSIFQQLVCQFLESQPIEGTLSRAAMYREWVIGVVFGAKDTALRATPTPTIVAEYVQLVTQCWESFSSVQSTDEEPKHFALLAITALINRTGAPNNRNLTFWRALHQLAIRLVNEGSLEDVHDIFFRLRRAPVEYQGHFAMTQELINSLCARLSRETNGGVGLDTSQIVDYAAQYMDRLAQTETATSRRNWIFSILTEWASEPFRSTSARHGARRMSQGQS